MKCQWCHMDSSFAARIMRDGDFIAVQCPHCNKSKFLVNAAFPVLRDLKRLERTKYFVLGPRQKAAVAQLMHDSNHLATKPSDVTFLNVPNDQYMMVNVAGGSVSFHFNELVGLTSMEFDLSSLKDKGISLMAVDENGTSVADAMSTLLERAQELVDTVGSARRTAPTAHVRDPSVLTRLITGRRSDGNPICRRTTPLQQTTASTGSCRCDGNPTISRVTITDRPRRLDFQCHDCNTIYSSIDMLRPRRNDLVDMLGRQYFKLTTKERAEVDQVLKVGGGFGGIAATTTEGKLGLECPIEGYPNRLRLQFNTAVRSADTGPSSMRFVLTVDTAQPHPWAAILLSSAGRLAIMGSIETILLAAQSLVDKAKKLRQTRQPQMPNVANPSLLLQLYNYGRNQAP